MPSSHQCLHSSPQTLNSPSARTRRGCSKAQICFFKILRLISSVPPSLDPAPHSSRPVHLNLRFCSHDAQFQCNSLDGSRSEGTRGEQTGRDVGKVSARVEGRDHGVDREETKIAAEIREEKEEDELEQKERSVLNENNRLDLLIEAASVILGNEESQTEGARRSEEKESRMVVKLFSDDTREKSPVVRTKRGRSQALPYRFRHGTVKTHGSSSRTVVDPHGSKETAHVCLSNEPTTLKASSIVVFL